MRLNVLHAVFGGVFFQFSVRLGSSTSTKVTYTEIKSIILDIFDVYKTADNNSQQVVKATPLSFNDR